MSHPSKPDRPTSAVGRLRQRERRDDPSLTGTGALVTVLAAWALLGAFMFSVSGGPHDEISGAAAVFGFMTVGAFSAVVTLIAGLVAAVRLYRHPGDRRARIAVILASLSVAAAGLIAWLMLRPVHG